MRPRLAAANCYAAIREKGQNVDQVSVLDEKLVISSKGNPKLEFCWPKDIYGAITDGDIHNSLISDDGATFRIRLSTGGLSVINPGEVLKVRRKLIKPCSIPDYVNEPTRLSLFCSACKTSNASVEVKRILPLPSFDWRGGIQDWFCSCNHGLKSGCSNSENELSNKKLHEKELGPRDGDLLYSSSYVLLHSSGIFDPNPEGKVMCKSCKAHLGDNIQKSVQLWHHSVVFSGVDGGDLPSLPEVVKPSETFLLLIGGICVEHDWMPIKIKLCAGQKIALCLWIIEPDLHLLTLTQTDFKKVSVLKVIYSDDVEERTFQPDQEIEVPQQVILEGIDHLESNQMLIPPNQRKDSNMKISYINLTSVTLK